MVTLETPRLKKLLDTAAKEFAAFGFKGASLNRILARANISKGVAYYHFKDKSDLFGAVVKFYWDHVMEEVQFKPAELTAKDYWPRLADLYLRTTLLSLRSPWMLGMMKTMLTIPREVRTRGPVARMVDDFRALLSGLVKRGQELDLIRTDLEEEFIVAVLMGMDEGSDHWLSEHAKDMSQKDVERHVMAGLDMVRRMVAPTDSEGIPRLESSPRLADEAAVPADGAPAKRKSSRKVAAR